VVTPRVKGASYPGSIRNQLLNDVRWNDGSVLKMLAEIGLLLWWLDVHFRATDDSAADWALWRKKILDRWSEIYPNIVSGNLETMVDELCDMEENIRTTRQPAAAKDQTPDKDVDMDVASIPHPFGYLPLPLPKSAQPSKRLSSWRKSSRTNGRVFRNKSGTWKNKSWKTARKSRTV